MTPALRKTTRLALELLEARDVPTRPWPTVS